MAADRILTPQTYPLWAALVPSSSSGQPLIAADGEPVTEEIVDFIYPSCYLVVAWEHDVTPGRTHPPRPVLLGTEASESDFFQFAQDREEAENLARLRIREMLKRQAGPVAARAG